MKTFATKNDVKSSAIYALKSGVAVRTVKNQLREHGVEGINSLKTRNELIIHLNKG